MSRIIGVGANPIVKDVDSKEFEKIEKKLVAANDSIDTLTTEKSALEDKIKELEDKIKELEPKSEDSESNDEDSENKSSNKKTKKDE